ncbi:hypothetical protein HELRODRAFT_188024 [Helobdella robusta]|uniref:Tudor domain-containing protein n=1 Tax=Helobdella robusta TaxID=6412 RepID=T1FPK0_HELRO|nr:hypothetical protein HELRODRAFT_188024 [Helobdella robusta]ESO12878.1 hypothetical protein HELRODRAFT_188024 [Helobdella robusta]
MGGSDDSEKDIIKQIAINLCSVLSSERLRKWYPEEARAEYKDTTYEDLPFHTFKCRSVEEFMAKYLGDYLIFTKDEQGRSMVQARPDEKTNHVSSLIARTKSKSKKIKRPAGKQSYLSHHQPAHISLFKKGKPGGYSKSLQLKWSGYTSNHCKPFGRSSNSINYNNNIGNGDYQCGDNNYRAANVMAEWFPADSKSRNNGNAKEHVKDLKIKLEEQKQLQRRQRPPLLSNPPLNPSLLRSGQAPPSSSSLSPRKTFNTLSATSTATTMRALATTNSTKGLSVHDRLGVRRTTNNNYNNIFSNYTNNKNNDNINNNGSGNNNNNNKSVYDRLGVSAKVRLGVDDSNNNNNNNNNFLENNNNIINSKNSVQGSSSHAIKIMKSNDTYNDGKSYKSFTAHINNNKYNGSDNNNSNFNGNSKNHFWSLTRTIDNVASKNSDISLHDMTTDKGNDDDKSFINDDEDDENYDDDDTEDEVRNSSQSPERGDGDHYHTSWRENDSSNDSSRRSSVSKCGKTTRKDCNFADDGSRSDDYAKYDEGDEKGSDLWMVDSDDQDLERDAELLVQKFQKQQEHLHNHKQTKQKHDPPEKNKKHAVGKQLTTENIPPVTRFHSTSSANICTNNSNDNININISSSKHISYNNSRSSIQSSILAIICIIVGTSSSVLSATSILPEDEFLDVFPQDAPTPSCPSAIPLEDTVIIKDIRSTSEVLALRSNGQLVTFSLCHLTDADLSVDMEYLNVILLERTFRVVFTLGSGNVYGTLWPVSEDGQVELQDRDVNLVILENMLTLPSPASLPRQDQDGSDSFHRIYYSIHEMMNIRQHHPIKPNSLVSRVINEYLLTRSQPWIRSQASPAADLDSFCNTSSADVRGCESLKRKMGLALVVKVDEVENVSGKFWVKMLTTKAELQEARRSCDLPSIPALECQLFQLTPDEVVWSRTASLKLFELLKPPQKVVLKIFERSKVAGNIILKVDVRLMNEITYVGDKLKVDKEVIRLYARIPKAPLPSFGERIYITHIRTFQYFHAFPHKYHKDLRDLFQGMQVYYNGISPEGERPSTPSPPQSDMAPFSRQLTPDQHRKKSTTSSKIVVAAPDSPQVPIDLFQHASSSSVKTSTSSSSSPSDVIEFGHVYAVKSEEDGLWYRGKVLNLNYSTTKKILINYVDFGHHETFNSVSRNMKFLIDDFRRLPMLSYEFKLAGAHMPANPSERQLYNRICHKVFRCFLTDSRDLLNPAVLLETSLSQLDHHVHDADDVHVPLLVHY